MRFSTSDTRSIPNITSNHRAISFRYPKSIWTQELYGNEEKGIPLDNGRRRWLRRENKKRVLLMGCDIGGGEQGSMCIELSDTLWTSFLLLGFSFGRLSHRQCKLSV